MAGFIIRLSTTFRRVLPLVLLAAALAGCASSRAPVATPPAGAVRGLDIDGVRAFRGIPYAAAPVGERRWRPPQPAEAWRGIRDATRYGPACAQPDSALLGFEPGEFSEDCLTLNVMTPSLTPSEPMPVMVWIHGGGFMQGSGNLPRLNGSAIPRKGVVLVTINYRLAVFGFLAHGALAVPGDPTGNYGLLDAVAALEWVQRNVAAFGGDPGRVTIFGESAGADAVNYLMVMPAADGLFQGAISQSSSVGMAPAPRLTERVGFNPAAERAAEQYAARFPPPPGSDAVDALRQRSTGELLAALRPSDRFPAVVDGRTLPDQAGRLFALGRHRQVPYLTGGVSWEASLGRAIGGGFSPRFAARLVPPADRARLYPGLAGEALEDAVFGDLIILSHSRYLATLMQQHGAPVYAFYLSYVASERRGRQPGVAHTEDIAFAMDTLHAEPDLLAPSRRDRAVAALMNDYWVEFARKGNPNRDGLPGWPEFRPRLGNVLEIGDEILVRNGFLAERMSYHLLRGQKLLADSR